MSHFSILRTRAEQAIGQFNLIWRDWLGAGDELTGRVKTALRNPWVIYPGSKPQSGQRLYASLDYKNAQTAEDTFKLPDHGKVYAREGTPYGETLVRVLKQLDPAAADGRATAQGMGAIQAVFGGTLASGDHVVASIYQFGTTRKKLEDMSKRYGIDVTFVDGTKPQEWEKAVRPNTKMFFFEPLGNPGTELVDVQDIISVARKPGRDILVVTDTCMTPLDPVLNLGADVAVISTTKLFGGGIDTGGAIMASASGLERIDRINAGRAVPLDNTPFKRTAMDGLTQSHRSSEAMLKRARLWPAQFRQQADSAALLAEHLDLRYQDRGVRVLSPTLPSHPQYELAQWQFSGSAVFSMDLGNKKTAFAFLDGLKKRGIGIVNNFGGPNTTVVHPASTTHSSLSADKLEEQGIGPGLVRISVGVERAKYLINTFSKVLDQITPTPTEPGDRRPRMPRPAQELA